MIYGFSPLAPAVLFLLPEPNVELVKTLRAQTAILGRSPLFRRTAKIGFGLLAAVFLLQFYWVRELLFMEVVAALGFVVVALIGAVYALGCMAVLWLSRLVIRAQGTWCPRQR